MKILIVDDEKMIREWMKFTISSLPIDISIIDIAQNGEEALKKTSEQYYDLIFLDILMPKMNGLDLLKKLNEKAIDSTLIVLSSHDEFKFAKEAIKYNVKEYLLKNECSKEKLSELVFECHEKCLNQQKAGSLSQEFLERVLNNSVPVNSTEIISQIFPDCNNKMLLIGAIETPIDNVPKKLKDNKISIELEGLIGSVEQISFYLFSISFFDESKKYDYSRFLYNQLNTKISCSYTFKEQDNILTELRNTWIGYQSMFYTQKKYLTGRNKYKDLDSAKVELICDKTIANIRSYYKNEVVDNLGELNNYFKTAQPTDIESVINVYFTLLSSFIIYNNKKSMNLTEKLETLTTKIHKFDCFTNLSEWILQIVENNSELINRNRFSTSVEKALEYIEENYKNIESISQIAEHVNLSFDYFSRHFKQEVGITLNSYLINFRLDQASLILISSNLTIQEVAEKVGIDNGSYFTKCFKNKFNMPPIQFRIQMKNR